MPSGGSRNRSGPQADPNSERSQQRGLAFKLLPRNGFTGRVPAYPLPAPTARERAMWKVLWRMPQAAMWNVERHRMPTIGHYCRLLVRCEDVDAPAALYAQLHRFADQLGLTPAGLKENGWRLAQDELAEKRPTPEKTLTKTPAKPAPVRRLRA
jgi:hypothetical protein